MSGAQLRVPFPWVSSQDGRCHEGASRPRYTVPSTGGAQGDGPLGVRFTALPTRTQAKSSPEGCPGGRELVRSLRPSSVTRSLSDLCGHSSSLDSVFREEQRTPGTCPMKQIGFFPTRLSHAFNMLIAL